MWKIIKFSRSCGTKILFKDYKKEGRSDISWWLNKTSPFHMPSEQQWLVIQLWTRGARVLLWEIGYPGRSPRNSSAVQYGEEPCLDCRLARRWLSHWCPGSSSMPWNTGIWLFVSCHQHHTLRDLAEIMPVYGSGNSCIDLSPGYCLWPAPTPWPQSGSPGSKPTKPQSGCRFQSCNWTPAHPSSSLQTVLLA